MYLCGVTIEGFRCFGIGENALQFRLNQGLTALIGENDGGKTAIMDALRFALGTTDQEWVRLQDQDFNAEADEIKIVCTYKGLSQQDMRAFAEFLTYGEEPDQEPSLHVTWHVERKGEVRHGRIYRRPTVRSGEDASGPTLPPEARDLLRATYLRPLRNAERALTSGRGSRLSEVLANIREITSPQCASVLTEEFDLSKGLSSEDIDGLGVLDVGFIADRLLRMQRGIQDAKSRINNHLKNLAIHGDALTSEIRVGETSDSVEVRLRTLLEKLDLVLSGDGLPGLGSSNLLFMACELLLLSEEMAGSKLLLIEEPEAHLHPQRQLRVMRFLQDQAETSAIQILVTTHSPNLASVIKLDNLVLVRKPCAYSMAEEETRLEKSDYRFLERYLDVTRANLFFARGVVIVEGPSEAILLPTVANLLGRDLAEYGVSVVNVGGLGLHRFARIFQRQDEKSSIPDIPVACLTDLDVMPDCAPAIVGRVESNAVWPGKSTRRWRANRDFVGSTELEAERARRRQIASGQRVRTFVSDYWTLEYDLALAGLSREVFLASELARQDEKLSKGAIARKDAAEHASADYDALAEDSESMDGCSTGEVLASRIYSAFAKDGVSKPIAAQYLAQILVQKYEQDQIDAAELEAKLPRYLVEAIEYVTEPFVRDSGHTGQSHD